MSHPYNIEQLEEDHLNDRERGFENLEQGLDGIDNKELKIRVIKLISQWKAFQKKVGEGEYTPDKNTAEENTLSNRFLDLIHDLDDYEDKVEIPVISPKEDQKKLLMYGILGLAGLVAILLITSFSFGFPLDLQRNSDKGDTTDVNPVPPSIEKLSLQCKTDKSGQNEFVEGDIIRLYYKVNKPCMLRIIYKLADGQQVLLEDDLKVGETQVGQWMEIGDGYEVYEPFGEEELYVFAQEKEFPVLQTNEEDGYEFIESNLETTLSKTRGLKSMNRQVEGKIEMITKSKTNL